MTNLRQGVRQELDPITLSTLWHRFDAITQQMGALVERSARSPIFTQGHDFSCLLTDGRARLLAQADGIPIHTGGASATVKAILDRYEGQMKEGHVYVANDPYLASGTHLPDAVFAVPVFIHGELLFFAAARGHHIDIGGGQAGGFVPGATEIFQEGIRLPPVLAMDENGQQTDAFRVFLANVRERENVEADCDALIGAIRRGGQLLKESVVEMDQTSIWNYVEAILDHGETMMRQELENLPDGRYRGEELFELLDGTIARIDVTLTIKGDQCTVDFSGSSPQIEDPRNSPLSNTVSAVYAALNTVVDPNIPHNEGTYRPIETVAPEGTLVNPTEPFPVGMCTWAPGGELIHACWRALAAAIPERVSAGWGRIVECNLSGIDSRSGRHFVAYLHMVTPGQGALWGLDGFEATSPTNCLGALVLPNAEIYEMEYPIRFERYELRPDGSGDGEFRGGSGTAVTVTALCPMNFSWAYEGAESQTAFGIAGGQSAAPSIVSINDSDPLPIAGTVRLAEGDRVTILHAGGGGWGLPERRAPEKVLSDVHNGLVSEQKARQVYPHVPLESR